MQWAINEFLQTHPTMSIRPSARAGLELAGDLSFRAQPQGLPAIEDSFALRIYVPPDFPADLPSVWETAGKIPRVSGFHINPDTTLCLGSPLRLLLAAQKDPTILGFVEACVVPYLYAVSHKLKFGGNFVFDELAHGAPGALADYIQLFELSSPEQAQRALGLLGMKTRRANKCRCPCGCGRRVGKCELNKRLARFRSLATRKWFRSQMPLVAT